jgi:hypothetical protein
MGIVNSFPYGDQKVYIYKEKDKFKFGIRHYTKVKDNKKLQFTMYPEFYSTQKDAGDKAIELIDNNLKPDGIWTTKPTT